MKEDSVFSGLSLIVSERKKESRRLETEEKGRCLYFCIFVFYLN